MTDASADPYSLCENCGRPRADRFCPRCGQNDRTYSRSIFPVLGELVRESFEFDGRLAQTLKLLLFKPGSLSAEFAHNRRARYMTPVRLYLFTSVVFFLTMSVARAVNPVQLGPNPGDRTSAMLDSLRAQTPAIQLQLNGDSVPLTPRRIEAAAADVEAFKVWLDPPQRSKLDDVLARDPNNLSQIVASIMVRGPAAAAARDPGDSTAAEARDLSGATAAEARDFGDPALADPAPPSGPGSDAGALGFLRRVATNNTIDALHDYGAFADRLVGNLSIAMFFLLPLYACMLAVLFFRKRRYYIHHLVFGMHVHSFNFIAATLMLGTSVLPTGVVWQASIQGAFTLVVMAYALIALRRFYGNSWFVTLFKAFVLAMLYATFVFPLTLAVLFLTA